MQSKWLGVLSFWGLVLRVEAAWEAFLPVVNSEESKGMGLCVAGSVSELSKSQELKG